MEPAFEPKQYEFLRGKVKLDLLCIEDELMEMPVLIQQCGELTAQAIDGVTVSKDNYNAVRATLSHKLRIEPLPSGKTRSEAQIDSEIDGLKEMKETSDDLSSAKLDAGLWQALMESLQTKAASIRTAAELIKAGFISTDYILNKRRTELRARPGA